MNYLKTLLELYKLKRHIKWNLNQMKDFQSRQLNQLLHYAWEHSYYYRSTFEKAGITEELLNRLPLSCFPTLDKQDLLEHFDELVTDAGLSQRDLRDFDSRNATDKRIYKEKYHLVHSSGSTGKPAYFVYDNHAWDTMLMGITRAALWGMSMPQIVKLLLKRPRIVYIAATDGRYGGAMAVGDGIDGLGARQMYLDINEPLENWIQKLKEFGPNIVIGYPSAIKILAKLVEKGKISLAAERVISCGEPLGSSLRKYLEKIFHRQIINFYGASESLALGVEADPSEGMLLFDDLNIIEVENGQVYLTCLYNYTQPLIRYHLTDTLQIRNAQEDEVIPFSRVTGLIGRNEDILWFQDVNGNEEFLHPLAVEGFCVEGLKDYQFRKTAKDALCMYIELLPGADIQRVSQELQKQLWKILKKKGLDYVHLLIVPVEELFIIKNTGKKPLILPEDYRQKGEQQDEKMFVAG